jgi:hypothetical protein
MSKKAQEKIKKRTRSRRELTSGEVVAQLAWNILYDPDIDRKIQAFCDDVAKTRTKKKRR